MKWHEIDFRVREELEGLQANPPVEAWLAISDAIDQKSDKKPAFSAINIAAAITVLIISSISAWFFLLNESSQPINLAQHATTRFMEPIYSTIPITSTYEPVFSTSGTTNQFNYYQYSFINQDASSLLPLYPRESKILQNHDVTYRNTEISQISLVANLPIPKINLSDQPNENIFSRLLSLQADPGTRFSFGAHYTPRYNYRMLQQHSMNQVQSIPFQSLEKEIMTYGAGFFLKYNMPGRWSIESGVSFIRIGQYVKDIYSYTHPVNMPLFERSSKNGQVIHPQSVITSHGNIMFSDLYHYYSDVQSVRVLSDRQSIENSGPQTLRKSNEGLTQLFSYLELPVAIRYELFRSSFAVQIKAGVAGHYLLQNDVFLGNDISQKHVGETHGIQKFNFSAIGGLSLDLPLTNKITFHLEPTAQIFLRPIAATGLQNGQAYPYSFMLQTGVSYGF